MSILSTELQNSARAADVHQIIAAMPHGVLVIDAAGRVRSLFIPAGFPAVYRARGAAVGAPLSAVLFAATCAELGPLLAQAAAQPGPHTAEFAFVLPGATHYLLITCSAVNAQGDTLIVLEDITARKQAELAERQQRLLAESLQDSAAAISSTLDLQAVLERILHNVQRVAPHQAADIMLLRGGQAQVVRALVHQDAEAGRALEGLCVPLDQAPTLRHMARTRQGLIIEDTEAYPGWLQLPGTAFVRAYLGAPIRYDNRVIGFLNLSSTQPGFFPAQALAAVQALADQAAIAIHNAQLYEGAQALAAFDERQRLARDLHDGVTQTLCSINLIAGVLPDLARKKPALAHERLAQLSQMAQGALAEMRALLLELRPEALIEGPLPELLAQLISGARDRAGIPISLRIEGDVPPLPAPVHIAFYRISQEALNNIAKHARAASAQVALSGTPGRVRLCVSDDGQGFSPGAGGGDHFGLKIMRERAEAAGLALGLSTALGQGTTITLDYFLPED